MFKPALDYPKVNPNMTNDDIKQLRNYWRGRKDGAWDVYKLLGGGVEPDTDPTFVAHNIYTETNDIYVYYSNNYATRTEPPQEA